MVKHVAPLPRDGQKHPLPLLLPVALSWLGEVENVLQVARLAKKTSFLCLFMLFVGIQPFCHKHCSHTPCHCAATSFACKCCHRHYRVKPSLTLLCCTCVLHQLLAAVKPHVTVLAGKVSSSPALLLSSNSMNCPTNMPSTPVGPVASRWRNWFNCVPSTWLGICLAVF